MKTKLIISSSKIVSMLLLIILTQFELKAQNEVAIGSATTKSNAILWLNGNGSQGLILPVVTNKSNVSNPDAGMIVYDNSDNKVWYRNSNAWVEVGGGTSGSDNGTLNLQLTGNQLALRDGTTVLNSIPIAGGTQTNGAFMVFQGGAWQYASLSGDVTGVNGTITITNNAVTSAKLADNAVTSAKIADATITGADIANNTITTDKLAGSGATSSQVLQWSGTAWVPATLATGGTVTNVTGTAPVTVANPTTTPTISIADAGISAALLADNAVTSAKIQDGTVTGADIAALTITSANIVDNSISAGKLAPSGAAAGQVLKWNGTNWIPQNDESGIATPTLANGQILVGDGTVNAAATLNGDATLSGGTITIANNAVTNAKLADNAVTTTKIAASAVDNTKLAENAVTTTKLATNAVDNTRLADNAVTNLKVADNAITTTKIQDGTITGTDIADNAITSTKILDGTITGPDIANITITADKLAPSGAADGQVLKWNGTNWVPQDDNAGTSVPVLADGQILTGNGTVNSATTLGGDATLSGGAITIANNAVSTNKIAAGAVDNIRLADNAVTTTKLAANAVDNTKLADNAVTNLKVADNAITTTKIQDGTITGADIAAATITTGNIADNAITAAQIQDASITGADIANATITGGNIVNASITVDKLAQSTATDNQVLQWNGTNWAPATLAGGGTVTQINTGTGLTGGPITNTGTISIAAGGVGTTELANTAVDATKLADNAVTTAKINANAVDNTKLADNAVTTNKIAANAVDNAKLADNAVTNLKVANDAITSAKIQDGTIIGADIAGTTITTGNLADNSITSAKIADGEIVNTDIANTAAIAVTKLAPGTDTQVLTTVAGVPAWQTPATGVTTLDGLTDVTVTTPASGQVLVNDGAGQFRNVAVSGDATVANTGTMTIANDAITTPKLAVNAVDNTRLADNSVTTPKIAANAVDNTKLADNAVTNPKVADNAITTTKIQDGTITGADIAATTITTGNIADNAITTAKLNANAVDESKLADNTVTAVKIAASAVDNTKLADNAVTTVKISDNAITSIKIADGELVNADISATAAVEVSKLQAGTDNQVLTTVSGVPTWQNATADFSTENVIPKGDGTTLVASNISDDGTTTSIISNSPGNTSFIIRNQNGGGINGTLSGTKGGLVLATESGGSQVTGFETRTGGVGNGTTYTGLFASAENTGSSVNYAGQFRAEGSTSQNIAVVATADQNAGVNYGLLSTVGGTQTNDKYGLFINMLGNGTRYGVYTTGENSNYFSGNVGIGTQSPSAKLDIIGNLKITDGTQAAGHVLTSDAAGNASWQPAGSGWGLTGNAGTNPATNFIGTTDSQPIIFKNQGIESMRLYTGYLSLGGRATPISPTSAFDVQTDLGSGLAGMYVDANDPQGSPYYGYSKEGVSVGYTYIDGITGDWKVNTSGEDRIILSNTGNLGIGINPGTDPSAAGLELYRNGISSRLRVSGSTANRQMLQLYGTDGVNTKGWAVTREPDEDLRIQANDGINGINGSIVSMNIKFTTGYVGIRNINPTEPLDVTGNIRFSGALLPNNLPGTAGEVLTSQGPGNPPVWQPAGAGSGWTLVGNGTTIDGTNFLGTTNGVPLSFRVNNEASGKIDQIKQNAFFGYRAGRNITGLTGFGDRNVAMGDQAMSNSTHARSNAAVGYLALFNNRKASSNTALGRGTLYRLGTAYNPGETDYATNNTAVGYQSLYETDTDGVGSGGKFNTAIGYIAGSTNTTGSNNTFLGAQADATIGTLTNATAIGFNAKVDAPDKIRLGDDNISVIEGKVGFTASSDRRLKNSIYDLAYGIDFIQQLRPVSYKLNKSDGRESWGFIAQEIEELLGTDKAILTIGQDSERTLGLRYTDFIAPMVKAMQEQQEEIDALKAQLSEKNEKVNLLENSVTAMQSELENIKRALGLEASSKTPVKN